MSQRNVKLIRKIVRENYDNLNDKLGAEKYSVRFKFAMRLILNKKLYKFIWE